ncbi:ribosomal protein S18-alanine N-acetyltransferase [Vreelandella populi]|uniref:ribosomal protein S18-alanine N-acetyltransferase n=1 Tax=Vreelandella populi TaxID=2498858 RepID=UPI000F8CA14B|nr:ribosomal protein S18-alanine N-acetyltransferase [Halomonas populi]RUR52784.1 ribosomal-protein-alanine N-acetyltransferase [Halomonas populi]
MTTELQASDYAALVALEAQAQSSVSDALLKEALAGAETGSHSCVLGRFQEEVLIGYAVLVRLPFDAELQAIGVLPACRHQGVGRELIHAVLAKASDWQSERVLLEVRASNGAAIGLYQRLGFSQDGQRKNYYPAVQGATGREDALLMSRALS